MSDGTHIEWTDATLNVVNGCDIVSPGCTNCYAMRSGGRNLPNHPATGLTKPSNAGHVWTGEVRFNEKALLLPLRWRRPRKIFWNAHGDLFHEKVPDEWIDRCFAVMALTPHHIHQVLTKRPERMREYLNRSGTDRPTAGERLNRCGIVWDKAYSVAAHDFGREATFTEALNARGITMEAMPWPLANVWLGVSVEDQQRADERIPILLDTPAAVRWLSCEPLLGPIDFSAPENSTERIVRSRIEASTGVRQPYRSRLDDLDWVVAGGESGPGARPMHPDWARSLRDQCAAAGVPFLFKQWGAWAPGEIAGDYLDPEKSAKGVRLFDGQWDECWSEPDGHCDDEPDLYRIGKKNAGRLLDGVQHDGYPQ